MSSAAEQLAPPAPVDVRRAELRWAAFAVTWAVAVLFHLAGNTRLAPNWGRALLGLAALFVLTRPRDPRSAALLAVSVLLNVWLEAPVLANHWLLHGFLALVVLGAAIPAGRDPAMASARLVGPARLLLLAFYAFAAFAKLNSDFFDPAVSCAAFYLRESADSWGGLALVGWLPSSGERVVAVVVAAVELSVPLLLVLRRTRYVGVVVALAFHYVLALDRGHQFFDFSSVLLCLFLLFLPGDALEDLGRRLSAAVGWLRDRWVSGPELLSVVGLAAVALVVMTAAGPNDWPAPPVLRNVGVAVWLVYGAAVFAVVALSGRRSPQEAVPSLVPAGTPVWLLVIPAIAFLNGLTPYLELKTQGGWNMYANLAVVDGESNHLLVRRSLPLTDAHERLVDIVESDDPSLGFYIDGPWLLPERQLLDHIAEKDGVVVRGRVDGEPVAYVGGEVDARSLWQQKFQVFRAVDAEGPVSCQPSFGPAR